MTKLPQVRSRATPRAQPTLAFALDRWAAGDAAFPHFPFPHQLAFLIDN
jgi:hypothetical protein